MHDVAQRLRRRDLRANGRSFTFRWRFLAILVLLLAGTAAGGMALFAPRAPKPEPIGYTELLGAIEEERVAWLRITPAEIVEGGWTGEPTGPAHFRMDFPLAESQTLVDAAAAHGVEVTFRTPGLGQAWRDGITIAFQLLILGVIGTLLFLHLRGQSPEGRIGTRGDGGHTTFEDVAGTQGAAEELREVVDFLRAPAAFDAMGARVPRGVLLVGPPGTGKTLLARAVAGEANVPFFHISGSEVTGFIVGLGAHRVRTLFRKARKRGGVIFIDELDALGGSRGRNRSHNEDDRTLNQLLVEMDGFAPSEGVVVIGATNRPEDLDVALKRPGRFDRIVTVTAPTVDGREAILRLHADRRRIPLARDVDLARLARLTPGATGAELANLLNEAAIAAVRTQSHEVAWPHFETARDRMLLGKERVGFRAAEREWRIVAWHEAGHALAGVLACPEDPLHKVTIQPRGQAMGVAHFAPDDDRHLYSRAYLEGQIIKGLGGRAAEEIAFGADRITGGAESDLVHVNRIARRMVYRLGMGRDAGLLVYDEEAGGLSAETQARMDAEVRAMLERLYARTLELLSGHRDALDALAQALLERETLDGEEALALMQSRGVSAVAQV